MATKAGGATKQWLPSRELRHTLAAWPAGEFRSVYDIRVGWQTRMRLVKDGYVEDAGHPQLLRTDKVMTVPKPRRAQQTKSAYKGLYPWSVPDHWQRLQGSAARLPHLVAWQLGNHTHRTSVGGKKVQVPTPFSSSRRSMREQVLHPMHIESRTQFAQVRGALAELFGFKAGETKWGKPLMDTHYGLPSNLTCLFTTPHGVRLLLLELGVEPGPTGFVAMPEPERDAELAYLNGEGLTVAQKYHAFMRGR